MSPPSQTPVQPSRRASADSGGSSRNSGRHHAKPASSFFTAKVWIRIVTVGILCQLWFVVQLASRSVPNDYHQRATSTAMDFLSDSKVWLSSPTLVLSLASSSKAAAPMTEEQQQQQAPASWESSLPKTSVQKKDQLVAEHQQANDMVPEQQQSLGKLGLLDERKQIDEQNESSSNARKESNIESDEHDDTEKTNTSLHVWQYNNPFFRRVQRDAFCHDCRHVCSLHVFRTYKRKFNNSTWEGSSLTHDWNEQQGNPQRVLHQGATFDEAQIQPSDLNDDCRYCLDCPEQSHWFGQPDEAAPPILDAVSHYLQSIPDEHRFPHNVNDWPQYFSDPANIYPQRTYFVEYNPSIIRIPEHQIPHAYRDEGVVYLAAYRVSTMHSCERDAGMFMAMWGHPENNGTFHDDFKLPRQQNKAGLALLREDLSIVTDAVFQFNGKGARKIEDIRLFVLHNQIYFGSYESLLAMWLVEPEKPPPWIARVEPEYGNWSPVIVDTVASCPVRKPNAGAKNLQYFTDGDNIIAEMNPMGEKIRINVTAKCPNNIMDVHENNQTLPVRSFGVIDELYFWKLQVRIPPLTVERGSTCCVPVQHNNETHLLGVSHSKFRFRSSADRHSLPGNVSANHYFSTFYIMEATEPYTVVARSGRFCLGFPSRHEVATQNPYARSTIRKRLRLGPDEFNCPAIHYVSGMADTPDGKHLIISYGVSDCTPRMIKVRIEDVMRILFPYHAPNG